MTDQAKRDIRDVRVPGPIAARRIGPPIPEEDREAPLAPLAQYVPRKTPASREVLEFLEKHTGLQAQVADLQAKNIGLEAEAARWRARAETLEGALKSERESHAETIRMLEAEAQRLRDERDDLKTKWLQVCERSRAALKSMKAIMAATLQNVAGELADVFSGVEREREEQGRALDALSTLAAAIEGKTESDSVASRS